MFNNSGLCSFLIFPFPIQFIVLIYIIVVFVEEMCQTNNDSWRKCEISEKAWKIILKKETSTEVLC